MEVIPVTGLWTKHTSAEIWTSRKYSSPAEVVGIEESFKEKCMLVQFLGYWNKCEKAEKLTVELV